MTKRARLLLVSAAAVLAVLAVVVLGYPYTRGPLLPTGGELAIAAVNVVLVLALPVALVAYAVSRRRKRSGERNA